MRSTTRPDDRERSRKRKLDWNFQQTVEGRSWKKFKTCELCGVQFIVNNWPDRRPRTPKVQGRPICPWCQGRRGKLRMTEHILVERLLNMSCVLDIRPWDKQFIGCGKCLPCTARRVLKCMLPGER